MTFYPHENKENNFNQILILFWTKFISILEKQEIHCLV